MKGSGQLIQWIRIATMILCGVTVLIGARVDAQTPAQLDARIRPPLRTAIEAILDSAAAAGLPTTALADKALEGVSKGADPSRILAAVRTYRGQLQRVRDALGNVPAREVEMATAAFRAGVPTNGLTTMQHALSKRSLVIPYAVLSALVRQGVPATEAVTAVVAQAKQADDQTLMALSLEFDRNIAAGLPAQTALVRAQGIMTGGGTERTSGGSTRRP